MWTEDANPVDVKANIKRYREEKKKFDKQQEEKRKRMPDNKVKQKQLVRKDDKTLINEKVNRSVQKEGKEDKKKKIGMEKNTNRNQHNVFQISENALGNDPRFIELFESLKK